MQRLPISIVDCETISAGNTEWGEWFVGISRSSKGGGEEVAETFPFRTHVYSIGWASKSTLRWNVWLMYSKTATKFECSVMLHSKKVRQVCKAFISQRKHQ